MEVSNIINEVNEFNNINTSQIIQLPNFVIDNNDDDDDNIILNDIKCIICQDNINNYKIEKLKCGCRNLAHKECLIEWLKIKNICPICRKNIINNTITRTFNIYNNDNISDTISISINNNDLNNGLNNGLNNNIRNNINIANININNENRHFPKCCNTFWIFLITILLIFFIIFPAIHKKVY